MHVSYAPPTLLRLASESPELLTRVKTWQSLGSFVLSGWCEVSSLPITYSEASWTGMLNRFTLDWDPELCSILGIDVTKLPNLADYNTNLPSLGKDILDKIPVRVFMFIVNKIGIVAHYLHCTRKHIGIEAVKNLSFGQ